MKDQRYRVIKEKSPHFQKISVGTTVVAIDNSAIPWIVLEKDYVAGYTVHDYKSKGILCTPFLMEELVEIETGLFGFSKALEYLLQGKDLMREGWNGKEQFVTVIKAGNAMYRQWEMQDCFALKNAQGEMQPGWVPSQGDLFATDWTLYKGPTF